MLTKEELLATIKSQALIISKLQKEVELLKNTISYSSKANKKLKEENKKLAADNKTYQSICGISALNMDIFEDEI